MQKSICVVASLFVCFSVVPAQHAQMTQVSDSPQLIFKKADRGAAVTKAYGAALENLLHINTVPYASTAEANGYNQAGLLSSSPDTFIRAGAGYAQPWTRDASINSWSAGSLLEPEVARNTLLSVLRRQDDKTLIIQQDNQWWDQVIWVTAAWNHYLVTGDKAFLANAYQAAQQTLARNKQAHFNQQYALYEGPAFLNDGIAGYPAPPADATESRGSFVLAYPGADKIMVLSTNCLYVSAFHAAALMAQALGRTADEVTAFNSEADTLTASIRKQLWLEGKSRFAYLLYPDGHLDESQEGSGLAFSLLFHVATPEQTAAILRSTHIDKFGLVDISPAFPRFAEHPGRHNTVVWPPIQAFWAQAALSAGDGSAFLQQLDALTRLTTMGDGHFWEIYNADTGKPDGGWQVGSQWKSEADQTWSATGYLRMIYAGIFGLSFEPDGLRLKPFLPRSWGDVTLAHMHYRGAELQIELHGSGARVERVTLDGTKQTDARVPSSLHGSHTLQIFLKD